MGVDFNGKIVEMTPEEYRMLSSKEKERVIQEGAIKKSLVVKFLVERKGMSQCTAYRRLKMYGRYVPLRSFLCSDKECYELLFFVDMLKEKHSVTLKDVAKRLNISYWSVYRRCRAGKILVTKKGRNYEVIHY